MLDTLQKLDTQALNFFREMIDHNSEIQVFLVRFFSDFEVLVVAWLFVVMWLYAAYKKDINFKKTILSIFYWVIFCFIIYLILNQLLPHRVRPEDVSNLPPLIDHLPDNSFPSGHAIFGTASTLAFFFLLRKKTIWILLWILSVLMFFSRIFIWVHFPWDIIAWIIVWTFSFWIYYKNRNHPIFEKYLFKYPILIAKFIKL